MEDEGFIEYTDEQGRSCRKCNCCGHIERKYEEHLSKVALIALFKIRDNGGECTSRDLDLNEFSALQQQSIRSNLQKLQYFGLVVKTEKRNWKITDFGLAFLKGEEPCPSRVIRYGEEIIEELEPVYISSFWDLTYIEDKDYYEDQARIDYRGLI